MTKSAASRDKSDHRLASVVNVLWAPGGAVDAEAAGRAFQALAEAGRLAAVRWPAFYRPPALVRLLYARADPPDEATLAAAAAAGLVVWPCEVREGAGALAGELAIVATPDRVALQQRSAALIVGASLRLVMVDPSAPEFEGIAPVRGDVAATPALLAEALFSPPRGVLERRGLGEYLREDMSASAMRFEYELLLRLIGERAPAFHETDDAWERAAALNAAANVDRSAALALLHDEYERADSLALAYGRRWRSTLAARSFLLFGTNLVSGLIGTLFPTLSVVTLPIQFAVTALLYLDQHISGRRRWRGKWIDYRRAAEATRIARFCLLGDAGFPLPHSRTWIDWRLDRLLRGAEPASALSEADAARFLAYLAEVEIDRQIVYHRSAFRRFRRLNARLRRAAVFALLATIVLGGALAVVAAVGLSTRQIPVLGAIGLALSAGPGLYAALNGLRSQLDVERQAARSARIGLALRRLRRSLIGAPPSAALARAAATRVAQIMHDDLSSWDRVMEIV